MTRLIFKRQKKILQLFLLLSWIIFSATYFLPIPLFAKSFFLLLMVTTSSIFGGFKWGVWSSLFFLCVRCLYHVVVPVDFVGLIGGFVAAVITAALIGIPVDCINRKEIERQKTEKKYHQLVETLQEGIWTIDKRGYTTYVNQAMADMLGYSVQEMEESSFYDYMEQEDIKKAKIYLKKRQQGIKEQHDFSFVRKDGERIYTTLETGPIYNEKGEIIGAIAGIQDITIRKKMENELIHSRNLLQSVFERTQEGVIILNKDLTIDQANSSIKRWKKEGLPLEGMKCFEALHGKHKPCSPCSTIRCMESQQMERAEMTIETAEGAKWLEIFSYPIIEEETGALTGAMEFIIDITDRKKAEQALVKSEKQLKATFEVASVGIVQVDPRNGNFLRFNKRYLEITGRTAAELMNKKFPELTHPEDRQNDWEIFSSAAQGKKPYYINEKRYLRKDGSIVWVRINAAFIRNDKGEPIRTVAVCEDITERKETEKELAQHNKELQGLYKRLDREVEKARAIHEQILPVDFPIIENISFAAHYQPAQKLGGDFYDLILLQNKLILYLSDVSGHGFDGSMLSLFVKHTIKSYLSFTHAHSISPAAILQHLADQFREEKYPEEYFVCIFLGVIDLETMNLSYSGVGFQDSPLVQLGNGQKLEMVTRGLFITSCFPERMKNFQEQTIKLTPGTTIFLNTDGLTEQQTQNYQYIERLPHVFYSNADQPPPIIAQRVLEDFQIFNNGSLQGDDDITFLVLQVKK